MDNPQHPDPSQELPAPPEEKLLNPASPGAGLLRPPTFWEKNGTWINWLLFILLILELVAGGLYAQGILGSQQNSDAVPTPTIIEATATPYIYPTEIPTPTLACMPRPACLDAKPRCMIPETPDMCPKAIPSQSNGAICDLSAKQCPDGSYVGRSGPNCEFVCPNN